MRIFISPNVNGPKELLLYEELKQQLRKLRVSTTSSLDIKKSISEKKEFEEFDALVLDGSSQDSDIGYYLAIALAHKKPVLYLLKKGDVIDSAVEALTRNKEVKKYIKIVFYSSESLVRKIKSFLQYLDQSIGKELYTIKYTLRLSPRLDRYITWKAQQLKRNKADYIRDHVNELMKSDTEFRERLN